MSTDVGAGAGAMVAAPTSVFSEHARRYAELGWALVRLDGKRPKDTGWETTSPDRDADHVAGLWSVWAKRWNMGVALGPSGLCVLEYDTDAAAARLADLLDGDLPLTPIAQTGSGRLHLYFRDPGVAKSARGGLELRTGAHQCVVPPSLHPGTGRRYRWLANLEPWSVELVDVPRAVLDHMASTLNGKAEPVGETIPAGQRRQVLLSLAGSMRRRGMDRVEILAALTAVNERRCRPPLPKKELDALADDIASRYEPAQNSFPPPIAIERGGNERERDGELPFAALAATIEHVPAEPPWLVRGYLAPSAVTLLAGRPKVGKSTLAFALLAALASGDEFAGLDTACAGILLLTEERRDTLAAKARTLGLIHSATVRLPKGGGKHFPGVHVLMRHDAGATAWPEIVRQAMAYCVEHELTVLVVDTWDRWTSLRGDNENAAGAVNEALEPLQYAAAAGLAVLLVSHQRKSTGEFGEAVRGSNALTGGVDIVAELERPSRTLQLGSHARVLRTVSRFDSTPEELHVELGDTGFVVIESPEQVAVDAERSRIAAVLESSEPATAETLGEELELPKSTVRRHLAALLEKGVVLRDGAGKKNDPYVWRVAP